MSFARQALGSALALLLGIAASVILARALGAEARGEYGLAVRVAGLILALAQWGIPEVLLQFAGDRREDMDTLVTTTLVMGVGGSVIVSAAVLLLLPLASDNLLRGVDATLILLAGTGSLISIVGLFARRYIQLGGKVALYNWIDVAHTVLFLILAIGLVNGLRWQAWGAMVAWLLGELLVAVWAGGYVVSRIGASLRFDRALARSLVVAGGPIQAGMLAQFVGNESGTYVLNAGAGLAAAGVYAVALSAARLVLQVSVVLRTVLQPRLVLPEADPAALTIVVARHGLLWMLLLAAAIGLASPLVPFVFGADFAPASATLVLLLPGMLAYGLNQLVGGYLLRVGQRGVLAVAAWAFAVAAVVLQGVGASIGGLNGAAVGLSIAYALATWIVLDAFARMTGRSRLSVLPRPSDLREYQRLVQGTFRPRPAGAPH